MSLKQLQQSYQQQLILCGICPNKAQQAAQSLSREELHLIGEIWSQWGSVLKLESAMSD